MYSYGKGQEKENVFTKLFQARQRFHSIELTAADVELLFALLGDEIGRAEVEIQKWQDIFEEYD